MDYRSLLLLGLLMSQSQHGYQIHDFIEKNLTFITNMKRATAYSLLDKLSKDGFIDVNVEYEGNRPPRKVYSINEKGSRHFHQLLLQNLSASDAHFYNGDIGLMFLDHLPADETIAALEKRKLKTKHKYEQLQLAPIHKKSSGVNFAFEHKKRMLEAELSFLTETIAVLKQDELE